MAFYFTVTTYYVDVLDCHFRKEIRLVRESFNIKPEMDGKIVKVMRPFKECFHKSNVSAS